MSQGKTGELAIRQPADDNPDWQPIYSKLVHKLGEPVAWSWFADVRLIANDGSTLAIAQWNPFVAAECLKRYGDQLAEAANANVIHVYRTGGFRPAHLPGSSRHAKGYEVHRAKGPQS